MNELIKTKNLYLCKVRRIEKTKEENNGTIKYHSGSYFILGRFVGEKIIDILNYQEYKLNMFGEKEDEVISNLKPVNRANKYISKQKAIKLLEKYQIESNIKKLVKKRGKNAI